LGSIIKDLSLNGVKPNDGTVEQKIVAIGALIEEAKCVIALSLE